MNKHLVKQEGVQIGVMADTELQKAFNRVRKELHLTSNSAVIRFVVMEKEKSFLQKNTSSDVIGENK